MRRHDTITLAFITGLISVASFLYFFRHDELLLYGDAVAHINIARRVFDSRQPGPVQLGTVWLPLPHVLMLPFIASDWAWRTGAGGAVISMAAYALGALGIFRLVRVRVGRKTAWLAALAYVANPNLIYLQTTAMTEPLYLALFIWAVVCVSEFFLAAQNGDEQCARRWLRNCAILTMGMLVTRYDGWFAAFILTIVFVASSATMQGGRVGAVSWRRVILSFVLPIAVVPIVWFAYNARVFGDAWAFARGPYSARAIAARSASASAPTHPGDRNPALAGLYFLKAAELNVGEGSWGRACLIAAVAGALLSLLFTPLLRVLLLLWIPLSFYALSIAYAGAPIFVPIRPPFSYYNVRYGLELLPALTVFTAILFAVAVRRLRGTRWQFVPVIVAAILVVASYLSVWRSVPISLREARVNSATRIAFERKLAEALATLPPPTQILMYTGDHVGALQRAGIHLKRTVNETLFRVWERALSNPARSADYVVAMEGDAVWKAVQARASGLRELTRISVPGQPLAVIYKTNPSPE